MAKGTLIIFSRKELVDDAAVPISGHTRATAGKHQLTTDGHHHRRWAERPALPTVVPGHSLSCRALRARRAGAWMVTVNHVGWK